VARRPQAQAAAGRATVLAPGVSARERGVVAIAAALVAGEGPRAVGLMRRHLEAHPRDMLVAQLAAQAVGSGRGGGDGDPRRERLALLEALAPAYGDDWAFLTAYGFALNETGAHEPARRAVQQALAGRPRSGAAAHVCAHVYYETGDPAAGAAFLDAWLPGYPTEAGFFVHNHWHLAVFELQRGRLERALEVYRAGVDPQAPRAGSPLLSGGGAVALLWRAQLAGHPAASLPWAPVRDFVARTGPRLPDAFRALWDAYEATAYAAAGDPEGHEALQARLAAADPAVYPAAAVVASLARALWAFARGDAAGAAALLEPLAPDLVRLGGSNEQRDTFDDTVVAAALRAGRYPDAEARLRRRLARRPAAQDSLWLAEVLAATGRREEARDRLGRARAAWAAADPAGPERAALARLADALESA
jgi:tetratricopeptide (TPR) repeat protein